MKGEASSVKRKSVAYGLQPAACVTRDASMRGPFLVARDAGPHRGVIGGVSAGPGPTAVDASVGFGGCVGAGTAV